MQMIWIFALEEAVCGAAVVSGVLALKDLTLRSVSLVNGKI